MDVYKKVLCVGMACHLALVLLEDLLVDEEGEALAGLLEAVVVFDEVELVEESFFRGILTQSLIMFFGGPS